jgi:DNA-binding GntR family transcriptional regulator
MADNIVDNIAALENTGRMAGPVFSPNSKAPNAPEIADWIRAQIRASKLVPGQRLIEVDIIRKTGGSRFKVREAFQRLAAEGLVEIEEFRGATVRESSMEEVSQLYQARAVLEGLCARDFTRNASAEEKRALQEIAQEMERLLENGTPELFSRLNSEWHTLIMRGSGNFAIAEMVRRLSTPVHRLLFGTFYRGERLREAVQDHFRILGAVLDGDAKKAEVAMRQHVESGYRFLLQLDRAGC